MKSPGDLAEQIASGYLEKYDDVLDANELAVDQEGPMVQGGRQGLFTKIDFRWRPSDRKLLEAIRSAADSAFADMYEKSFKVIDDFYAIVRVQDGSRVDVNGRKVWLKDEDGQYKENWDQLTASEIEKTIFHLQRIKFSIADQQSQLLSEAILAKHAEDDIRNETWLNIMDGTQGDRNARASRDSLADKYHAFFRYTLYQRAQAFTREIDNFGRLLEKLLYRRN